MGPRLIHSLSRFRWTYTSVPTAFPTSRARLNSSRHTHLVDSTLPYPPSYESCPAQFQPTHKSGGFYTSVPTFPRLNFSRHTNLVDSTLPYPPSLGSISADTQSGGFYTSLPTFPRLNFSRHTNLVDSTHPYPPSLGSISADTPTEHLHTSKVGVGSSLPRTSFFINSCDYDKNFFSKLLQ